MNLVEKPEGRKTLRGPNRRWNMKSMGHYWPDSCGSDKHQVRNFVNKMVDIHETRIA